LSEPKTNSEGSTGERIEAWRTIQQLDVGRSLRSLGSVDRCRRR
jgi:hypothetical protein